MGGYFSTEQEIETDAKQARRRFYMLKAIKRKQWILSSINRPEERPLKRQKIKHYRSYN